MKRPRTPAPAPAPAPAARRSAPNPLSGFLMVGPQTRFDPGAYYEVKLSRAIKFGPQIIRPGAHKIVLSSDMLAANRDAVAMYKRATGI